MKSRPPTPALRAPHEPRRAPRISAGSALRAPFLLSLSVGLAFAVAPACNAVTGIDDYAYDRACKDAVTPHAEDCSTEALDENCDGFPRCSTDGLWAKSFGKAGSQDGRAVAFDHDRNLIVAGTFDTDIDVGVPFTSKGDNDVFIVKMAPTGEILWQRQLGGMGKQGVGGVAVDSQDNIVVVGSFDGSFDAGSGALTSEGADDIYIIKLDQDGGDLWAKQYGGPMDQRAAAVAIDPSNNILVTGSFSGALDFGSSTEQLLSVGGLDVFVVKLDTTGSPSFSAAFGDVDGKALDQLGTSIVAARSGDFYVGGSFQGSLIETPEGIVQSTGDYDAFIIALSASSAIRWAKRVGSEAATSRQALTSMALGPDGGVFIAGLFTGDMTFVTAAMGSPLMSAGAEDIFLARLTPNGTPAWYQGFGTADAELAPSLASDGAGNAVLAGSIVGAVNFGVGLKPGTDRDIFLAKFAADGKAINSPRFIANDTQHSEAVATDALGDIAITGSFRGLVKFEGDTSSISSMNPAPAAADAFIAFFRP